MEKIDHQSKFSEEDVIQPTTMTTTSQDSWEDCKKCIRKVSEKIFIGVGDIHPDGQPRTDGAQIIIPHNFFVLVGDNKSLKIH